MHLGNHLAAEVLHRKLGVAPDRGKKALVVEDLILGAFDLKKAIGEEEDGIVRVKGTVVGRVSGIIKKPQHGAGFAI